MTATLTMAILRRDDPGNIVGVPGLTPKSSSYSEINHFRIKLGDSHCFELSAGGIT